MRTLEEVRATLQIAKLKEEDLQKTIHCLSFGENVSSADYCLMELDDTLCKQIEAGQRCGTVTSRDLLSLCMKRNSGSEVTTLVLFCSALFCSVMMSNIFT